MMAQKSKLMSMNGESEDDSYDDMGEEQDLEETPGPEYDETMPESIEPGMGMNAAFAANLQKQEQYFNPVTDNEPISEAEREALNPSSDPYTQTPTMVNPGDINAPYRTQLQNLPAAIQSLQEKAKTRALATTKFQDQASKKV